MKDIHTTIDESDTWMEKTGGYAKDMTLRDYFAAKAMQELLKMFRDTPYFSVARYAYQMADEMLKAREA